ncbi:unnamed protein product [Trichogramma brassicae]|uniref:Uncharacterized protein n=1 Tax=Trichogramma brassicae TaxID=86971 RepID=A0A6H5HVC7_9HYME|nr:unnamed protein product [Trichogramma brassicae]
MLASIAGALALTKSLERVEVDGKQISKHGLPSEWTVVLDALRAEARARGPFRDAEVLRRPPASLVLISRALLSRHKRGTLIASPYRPYAPMTCVLKYRTIDKKSRNEPS